jgi:enoyl-CoA hydratase
MTRPGEGEIVPRRRAIDRLFAYDHVADILAGLDREAGSGSGDAGWAAEIARTMRAKSPTSLKIALRQMRVGKTLSFEDCMAVEFRIVSRILDGSDFYEGVRSVIIDKDNRPAWQPHSLDAVSDADVARHFAPLGDSELVLT